MSGNDEQPRRLFQQKEEYERLAELRREEARTWIPHIKELVSYARMIAGNSRLKRVIFNRLVVEQMFETRTDPYDLTVHLEETKRYKVYIKNGILRKTTNFVMDFEEDTIHRFIPGPWTSWLHDYKSMAKEKYERRLLEKRQREDENQRKATEKRIKELIDNFNLEG